MLAPAPMSANDTTVVHDRTPSPTTEPVRPTEDDAVLPRGARLGRHVVLGVLGRGGMGVVYRAYDPQLDRQLALKRLRAPGRAGAASRARLRREAQTLAKLDDPNVVTIYDVGEDAAGLYIAMELVEGEDLSTWLVGGPHPWPAVLERMVAAGRGLAAAHRVGVVHRDFKPGNVLLGKDGRVAVTDFGLARPESIATGSEPGDDGASDAPLPPTAAPITVVGTRVGTPAYMAPEQHAGEPADGRSDQFAFCVTLFEALYGRRPFLGETETALVEDKRRGLRQWPAEDRLPRSIPSRLRRLLARGLDPDPARRFPSMQALLAQLDPDRRTRRRWTTVAALGGLGLATLVGIGLVRARTGADPCAGSSTALTEVWNPDVRERMQAALAAVEVSYAERAAETATTGIDAWAERWTTTHRAICEATWRDHAQPARALDLRMGCLDEGRQVLAATVEALAEPTPRVVEHATTLVLGLPAPEPCRALVPTHDGATASASAEGSDLAGPGPQLGRRLADLQTMRRSGRGRDALRQAEVLRREVEPGLGPGARMALLYELGVLRDDAGDFVGARQALQTVAQLARTHGDARREADAFIELTRIVGAHLHQAEEGMLLGRQALAAVAAMEPASDPMLRADALVELGEVAFRSGDDARALEHLHEAEALRREHYGDGDVRVAEIWATMAGVEMRGGDPRGARARLEAVIETYGRVLGPEHPRMAAPLGNLGLVLTALGEHEAALASMRRALAIAERSRGPDHPQVAGGHDSIGHVLTQAGRDAEAEAEFEAAIDGFDRTLGPQHPAVTAPLLGLGQVRLRLGRPAEAIAPLERALALVTAADLPPIEGADVRFALARALREREPTRAQALADAAIAIYEAQLSADDVRWSEIRAWRAEPAPTTEPPAP